MSDNISTLFSCAAGLGGGICSSIFERDALGARDDWWNTTISCHFAFDYTSWCQRYSRKRQQINRADFFFALFSRANPRSFRPNIFCIEYVPRICFEDYSAVRLAGTSRATEIAGVMEQCASFLSWKKWELPLVNFVLCSYESPIVGCISCALGNSEPLVLP